MCYLFWPIKWMFHLFKIAILNLEVDAFSPCHPKTDDLIKAESGWLLMITPPSRLNMHLNQGGSKELRIFPFRRINDTFGSTNCSDNSLWMLIVTCIIKCPVTESFNDCLREIHYITLFQDPFRNQHCEMNPRAREACKLVSLLITFSACPCLLQHSFNHSGSRWDW